MRLEAVVYIDVLFGVNFIGNFLILWAVAKLLHLGTQDRWLFLGAAVGALYAVLMFFPRFSFGYTLVAKFLFSLFLVALTYRIRGAVLYIKTLAVFYLVTFAFGGSVLAFFYFTGAGMNMGAIVRNGVLYFEMPWHTLFLAFMVSYPLIRFACRMMGNRLSEEHLSMDVCVTVDGRSAVLRGLVDTGNHLRDPFTDAPVLIAEYEQVQDILPREFCEIYEKAEQRGAERLSEELASSAFPLRLRLIPFRSIGKENGMLVGFKPDRLTVSKNEQEIHLPDVVVGLYAHTLSGDKKYGALLAPEMVGISEKG